MAERCVLYRFMEAIGDVVMSAVTMVDAGVQSREAVMAAEGEIGTPVGVGGDGMVVDVAGSAAAVSAAVVKRKRGRPRKTETVERKPSSPVSAPAALQQPEKRGRGRPKGSGNRQLLPCSGGDVNETMGENFKIRVVTVHIGEDIVTKIQSFSQSSDSVCVVSATGAVSSVVLRQPGASGGTLRFEGVFEILSLKGLQSFGGGVASRRPNIFSIVLAKPDGRVFGGAVTGPLIAAGPIQLVVGTFKETVMKERKMARPRITPAPPAPAIAANLGQEFMNSANDFNGMGMLGDGTCEMPTSARLEPILDAAEDLAPQNN